ncbi:glycosyltransferase [Microbacterium sp. ARD31]|uniref:glycosyltransferase family 2 protein n=1 Tax=Microbacterium sp. ARD31 TaxID=2962576 RepID=UPI002880F2EC|nr:glycosyltransferase [Microbacterium sp. ARD31]MDT0182993.1 glycosyltransferase [Microbacterium sp. ARD31]
MSEPGAVRDAAASGRGVEGPGRPDGQRRVSEDRWVPGNRWNLVDGLVPDPLPRVSVIVAHYEQGDALARTLRALARQEYPPELLEVIVADDGSRHPIDVPEGVRVVRQEDRGFRLSAVRNLGVRASTGEVLCFLDADTAPETGYVRTLTRLPALLPDAVTVGRRRHADLSRLPADAPISRAAETALPEPEWLADEYARTGNLLEADDRSYRYVIGAVMACSRALFDEVGGFDESFTEYGGEDWEWTHRAWQAGAVLAHVPEAVAWHDGPDWAGREDDRRDAANTQTLRLAAAIPVAGSAGRGLLPSTPDLVVHLRGVHAAASVFVFVDSVLAAFPLARVVLDEVPDVDVLRGDPRVVRADAGGGAGSVGGGGGVGDGVGFGAGDGGGVAVVGGADDARVTWTLDHPVGVLASAGRMLADRLSGLGTGSVGSLELRAGDGRPAGTVVSRRARRRAARWGTSAGFDVESLIVEGLRVLTATPHVEAYVGGWGTPDRIAGR